MWSRKRQQYAALEFSSREDISPNPQKNQEYFRLRFKQIFQTFQSQGNIQTGGLPSASVKVVEKK